ncbi:MAG: hypothetical protein WCK05_15740 [Planctomycetota bacterium]
MPNDILTPEEVDCLLRYPRGRAVKLAKAGLLPAIILPDGEIRFDRQAISEALEAMGNRPHNAPGGKAVRP